MNTSNRLKTMESIQLMEYLRQNKEELQKLNQDVIARKAGDAIGRTLTKAHITRFIQALHYEKPPIGKKALDKHAGSRIGRIEVIVAELLVVLEQNGLKCARRLLEKLEVPAKEPAAEA